MSFLTPLTWELLVLALLILAFVIFLDFRYTGRGGRWIRFTLTFTTMAAAMALYLRPFWLEEAPGGKLAIITSSISDSLITNLQLQDYEMVSDFQTFSMEQEKMNAQRLLVAGVGLAPWELDALEEPFEYVRELEHHEGLIDYTTSNLAVGVNGRLMLKYAINADAGILIQGSGLPPIARKIRANSNLMEVDLLPQVSGNLVWEIALVREKDTIAIEKLPVMVNEAPQRNVLVLSGAPSFELRFIKSYLLSTGLGVAERQQLSRDAVFEAFAGMNEVPLKRLDIEVLSSFAVVIMDDVAYAALSNLEKTGIDRLLALGRLGLIWLGKGEYQGYFDAMEGEIEEVLFGQTGKDPGILLKSFPVLLQGNHTPVKQGNTVTGWVVDRGLGKVLVPRFADSFKLRLKGKERLYNNFWSRLFDPVLPGLNTRSGFRSPRFPRVNAPTHIDLAYSDSIAEVKIGDVRVGINQSWFSPNMASVKCWPSSRGWTNVELNDRSIGSFFVFDSADWALQYFDVTSRANEMQSSLLATSPVETKYRKAFVPKWLAFAVVLLSMAGLWLERRLN